MSITHPQIDNLLEKTEENPFLLCSIASKRATDIHNMLHGQHLRVMAVQDLDDITTVLSGKDSIGTALNEIEDGVLSYNQEEFDETLSSGDTNN